MNNKKVYVVSGIIALVVALVVGLGFVGHSTPTTNKSVGQIGADGGTYNSPVSFAAGLSLDKSNELQISKRGVIGAGSNQASFQNTTGRVIFIDYAEVGLISPTNNFNSYAVASSSMRISIGTSTTPTIANNFAAPYSTLVDNALIATSSAGTVINSDYSTSGNAQGSIEVLPGQYVFFLMRQNSGNACTGATCETATSTNRGFNLEFYAQAHYQQ